MKKFILIGLLGFVFASNHAQACPVCFAAEEDTRWAFLATTVILSCLPWTMVAGFVIWVRRKNRRCTHSIS